MRSKDNKIILLGGGGHAKVLIELIRLAGQYEIEGILDSENKKGDLISNIPVLGTDAQLSEFHNKGFKNICIAVGSVNHNGPRRMLYEKVTQSGYSVPNLIHPRSILSTDSTLSEGVQVMAGATVQPYASIGENTIVNTGTIVEHDCYIGKHVHLCPGAVVCGGCVIGDDTFVGAGATVIQKIKIGKGCMIAAGAVVVGDLPDGSKVKGVPAK